jgi:hypothetical protein
MSDSLKAPNRSLLDRDLKRPSPVRRRVRDVFVIPCERQENLPDDVAGCLSGWELRVHRLDCGHTMGPYLLRADGREPPGEIVCWQCQKGGTRLRQGNRMGPQGTSQPEPTTQREEEMARERASNAYHDHPSNPSSCEVYEKQYKRRCLCERRWREFLRHGQ